MNHTRNEMIAKYGADVIAHDEETWRKRGYRVNYSTGLLERI